MFGFLGVECGWTKEYILDNLTFQQCRQYVESIIKKKQKELRTIASVISWSCANGMGGVKEEQFLEFLNTIYKPKVKSRTISKDEIKQAVKEGIIEEV